ncbi:MAG: SYNERG-CTERM sorting domain-containing protein [Synergistaceae bacterium]|nr:SYNERG-CTERM sorting domain-containing protein [Synergistaceae bacterium]
MKGTKASSGGNDPTNPDNPNSDVDEILGGSSGGCDAGFGALALALAASMIFVRKRS